MSSNVPHQHPLIDLELSRRLERTEAVANAAFVDARAQIQPEVGARWIEVAGVYAMFDGPESPITQTFGLGLFEPVAEGEFAEIEGFFRERGAPVNHEISPLIPSTVLALLNARGYHPIEFSSVLVRSTDVEGSVSPSMISAHRIELEEIDQWSRVAAKGWSSESSELAHVVEGFGRVIGRARGAHCFLAHIDHTPIAAAGLILNTDIALLAGASTVPESRNQGAQRALLEARLLFAADNGARLAMMVAQPGGGSHRNAERQGFRVAYTRTKWQVLGDGT